MFAVLRSRLSYANVVATLALLFAMSGGALAASKFLIVSTKQIKPSVLAQLKGKAGANGAAGVQGPAGQQGAQGPQGPQGPAGANGKDGAAGAAGPEGAKGATGSAGSPGPAGQKGATGPTGSAGPTGVAGPTGPEGSPWVSGGVLPQGQTETGAWAVNEFGVKVTTSNYVSISFPIPLKAGGSGFYIDQAETERKEGTVVKESGCTGSAEKPTAPEGKLCIYTAEEENVGTISFIEAYSPGLAGNEFAPNTYGPTGAYVQGFLEGSETKPVQWLQRGTWAVTAPVGG